MSTQVSKLEIEALKELANRKCDTLDIFRPLPNQEPFFSSGARETLLRGGNRAGKSVCVAAKFASIARDKPIILANGKRVSMRRKYQKGKCLTMWVIGYDARHIGETIHRLLFQPNLFRVIRNSLTGDWETYNENIEDHAERSDEAIAAPPLIPESWIVPGSWDWENLGNKEFNKVEIYDPTNEGRRLAKIYAYSSKGDPKAGDPVDHIWIDEAIRYPKHYSEWQARTLDRKGRIDWSSWPAMNNSALRDLTKRAKKCKEEGTDHAAEIVIRTDENKFFTDKQFKEWAAGFSEAEYLARVSGEYQTDGLRMYPLFSKDIHSAIIDGANEDELSKTLRENNMEPPEDWTRELVLDPGTANPAVIFCAIPPPQFGEYYVVYDEICVPRLDAKQLATRIKPKMGGNTFNRFIIDGHAARTTPMGFGVRIGTNYSIQFEELGIYCTQTGSQFTYGSDNVAGRIQVLQDWMHIQSKTGLPKLRIVTHRCPTLCEQLNDYEKQLASNVVADFTPAKGQVLDAAVCLEYWASRHPTWVPPVEVSKEQETMQTMWEKMKKMYFGRGNTSEEDKSVLMGPPT